MTQYIKEYGIIDDEIQTLIEDYIRADKRPLTKSELYVPMNDKKIIDEDKRVSYFKTFVDKKLFALVDILIEKLNKKDKYYNYVTVKNDVTYIKYNEGGFFKSHSDYLSITSNIVEEYTLLISMNEKECEGGETKFTINYSSKYVSKESIIPKHTLLFRKDLIHEGLVVKNGTKEIITINLWAIPKINNNILVIKMTNEDDVYAISQNNIMEIPNKFRNFILETKKNGTYKQILYYQENETKKRFEVIYKILTKQYIQHFEYNIKFFKYYGIKPENILLTDNSIKKNINYKCDLTKDLIYCINQEQQIYLCDKIKKNNLPYVPFTIIFVEGTLIFFSDHDKPEKLIEKINNDILFDDEDIKYCEKEYITTYNCKMMPVFASFSECNNILFSGSLLRITDLLESVNNNDDPQNIYEEYRKNSHYSTIFKDKNIDIARSKYKYINFVFYDDFNINIDNIDNYEESVISDDSDDSFDYDYDDDDVKIKTELIQYDYGDRILYYGFDICSNISPLEYIFNSYHCHDLKTSEISFNKKITKKGLYYDIDKNNKMFLNKEHFSKIITKIDEMKLFNKIKSDMNNIDRIICQHSKQNVNHHFCNENIYGNTNIISVFGFIKME
jgi:hypothetical protein